MHRPHGMLRSVRLDPQACILAPVCSLAWADAGGRRLAIKLLELAQPSPEHRPCQFRAGFKFQRLTPRLLQVGHRCGIAAPHYAACITVSGGSAGSNAAGLRPWRPCSAPGCNAQRCVPLAACCRISHRADAPCSMHDVSQELY